MIQLDQLSKNYGSVKALDDISLNVQTGEIIGLLGPNGAGKTTAMKIITCYMPPSSGRVSVDGLDVVEDALTVRRKIGYLPENNPLYLDMSVDEYLSFCARLHQIPISDQASAIDRTIKKCGIEDHRNRFIGELSKGYRQRVGLAQAILHDPEVLVLDEPTTGLDPNQIVEIRSLIRDLGREKTVILSTHIMQEVQAVCSRVLIIDDGRIVADDTTDNLVAAQTGNAIYSIEIQTGEKPLDGAARIIRESLDIKDLQDVSQPGNANLKFEISAADERDLRADIFNLAVSNSWCLLQLHRNQSTMEDVFRDLTSITRVPGEDAAR
jgi:ABC-2 type transport system ATP-binding protein